VNKRALMLHTGCSQSRVSRQTRVIMERLSQGDPAVG
jgi:hypothetical protein